MSGPLLPTDPASIGGHRLLARLGSGGMGVVYLGRTEAGTLAAVKVIHAEYADEPDFRARFRREVEAARRVTSPSYECSPGRQHLLLIPTCTTDAERRRIPCR